MYYFVDEHEEEVVGTGGFRGGVPIAEFDSAAWDELTFIQKQWLVWHELTHAMGSLTHDDGYIFVMGKRNLQVCPYSVMNSYLIEDDSCFLLLKSHYIQEIKQRL